MSLSNPTQESPVKKYIRWSGGNGTFQYYDKASEANVSLPDVLHIVILDELNCITGFDDQKNKGIYSNEFRSFDEIVNVKCDGKTINTGTYNDVKSTRGAKYCKSVYALLVHPDESKEIVNIKLSGSGVGPWIEAGFKHDGSLISCKKNPEVQTKGATKYYIPDFVDLGNKEYADEATQHDRNLQAWLNREPETEQTPEPSNEIYEGAAKAAEEIDDLPF